MHSSRMRTAHSSSRHDGGVSGPDPPQFPPWVWAWIWSPSISPLGVGLDLIPLNFPLGCGPGPDPPPFSPWVWAWRQGVCSGGGGVCSRGMSAPGGISAPGLVSTLGGMSVPGRVCSGGCLLLWGVCSGGRGVCGIPAYTEADTPPVNRITDACKNITLPQLRWGR